MNLKMYTDYAVNEIKTNKKIYLSNYDKNEKFVDKVIENYENELYNLNIDVEYPKLNTQISTKNSSKLQWEIDCENAILLHKEFVLKYNIPLSILTDERFIMYLTHDIYYEYMKERWPVQGKMQRVDTKYFLPSGSQGFTRNMFMRFFWYSYITYDKNATDPYELTKIAFEYADPVNQIMERKYGRNMKIVHAALRAIKNIGSKELNKKRTLLGRQINNIISLYALDIMNERYLTSMIETEIKSIIESPIEDDQPVEEE